jgi:hypothetical protein
MDILHFFLNPIGESLSSYTDVFGTWFYAILMTVIGIYVLIKTESWHGASAILLLMALLFSAILPGIIVFIWSIAVGLSFAFMLVDLLVLK